MSRAVLLIVLVVGPVLAAEARVELSQAPAPAPSMDAGAGYLVTYSGAFVCSSLILSLVALLFH